MPCALRPFSGTRSGPPGWLAVAQARADLDAQRLQFPAQARPVGGVEHELGTQLTLLDLGRAAPLDDLPPGQHAHRVGGLRLLQVVRGQDHGGAGPGPFLAQVGPQAPPARRVKARGRLVEEQHPGPVHQRPDDLQPPPLAAGQGARAPAQTAGNIQNARHVLHLAAIASRHQAVARPPRVQPVEHRMQPDVLLGGQVEVERGLLEDDADLAADLGLLAFQVPAGDGGPAGGGGERRGEDRHGRRLPRAVGSEQAEQLPFRHVEADAVHRVAPGAPVAFDQVSDVDRGHRWPGHRRRSWR